MTLPTNTKLYTSLSEEIFLMNIHLTQICGIFDFWQGALANVHAERTLHTSRNRAYSWILSKWDFAVCSRPLVELSPASQGEGDSRIWQPSHSAQFHTAMREREKQREVSRFVIDL